MVEHPRACELPLVNREAGQEQAARYQRREDLCTSPCVYGDCGREAEREKDQTRNEQEIPDPIQLREFFSGRVFLLQLPCGRMVQDEHYQRREPIRPGRDVPERAEPGRIIQRQRAADQQTQDPAHCGGRVRACLSDGSIPTRQDLACDRVDHRLCALAQGGYCLPGDRHADRVGPRDNDAPDAAEAAQDDHEPPSAPEVRGLRYGRAQASCADRHRRHQPCRFVRAPNDRGHAAPQETRAHDVEDLHGVFGHDCLWNGRVGLVFSTASIVGVGMGGFDRKRNLQ